VEFYQSAQPFVVVVGADGFVGGALADGLNAQRVVYGAAPNSDIHITRAEEVLRKADVVINTSGFRVRRGLSYADYQRCHEQAAAAFVPWIRQGALFIHMSSAHVLGKSQNQRLGNEAVPNPATYPCSAYAIAKLEADQFIEREAAQRDFRLVFLRPTILWSRRGDGSLPDNLVRLAKRGVILRLYPRAARHHLCNINILVDVARRVSMRRDLPQASALVVADPFTVTSDELEILIRKYLPATAVTLPIPTTWFSALLRGTFHSSYPAFDLKTWGDILGVLNFDTVYDPFESFRLLGIDSSQYSMEKTLLPFIQQILQP